MEKTKESPRILECAFQMDPEERRAFVAALRKNGFRVISARKAPLEECVGSYPSEEELERRIGSLCRRYKPGMLVVPNYWYNKSRVLLHRCNLAKTFEYEVYLVLKVRDNEPTPEKESRRIDANDLSFVVYTQTFNENKEYQQSVIGGIKNIFGIK